MVLGEERGGVVGMRWRAGERECFQARVGEGGRACGVGGQAGRPDWTATETLSAAWLLPKDLASISLRCLLFLLRCCSLLLLLAPSSPCSLPPTLFLALLLYLSPSPPAPRLGHYRHSAAS